MKSKRDLATAVLRKLTVTSLADTPAPEDSIKADETVQSVLDELVTEDLIVFNYIADLDTAVIPDSQFNALIDVVAYDLAPNFGKALDIGVRTMGINRLRRMILQGYDPIPVEADYF